MSGRRCAECGLINWNSVTQCKRCSHDLSLPSNGLNSKVQGSRVGSGTDAENPNRFTAAWIVASVCAFVGSGMGFATYMREVEHRVGGGSITGAVVCVIVGGVLPLLGAQLIISHIRSLDQPKRRTKTEPESSFGITPLKLPPVLMVLRAVIVLAVTITTVLYSGIIIQKADLPDGPYPVMLLALPVILAGPASFVIVDRIIAACRRK